MNTQETRLRDIKESKRMVLSLQQYYKKLLQNFDADINFLDDQIAQHQQEIANLESKKDTLVEDLNIAPDKLEELEQQLEKLKDKEYVIRHGDSQKSYQDNLLKKRDTLKEKLEELEQQLA